MAVFTSDVLIHDSKDLPSSGWTTALGILLLVGTIFHEFVGINVENPFELVRKGADILSIYLII